MTIELPLILAFLIVVTTGLGLYYVIFGRERIENLEKDLFGIPNIPDIPNIPNIHYELFNNNFKKIFPNEPCFPNIKCEKYSYSNYPNYKKYLNQENSCISNKIV